MIVHAVLSVLKEENPLDRARQINKYYVEEWCQETQINMVRTALEWIDTLKPSKMVRSQMVDEMLKYWYVYLMCDKKCEKLMRSDPQDFDKAMNEARNALCEHARSAVKDQDSCEMKEKVNEFMKMFQESSYSQMSE